MKKPSISAFSIKLIAAAAVVALLCTAAMASQHFLKPSDVFDAVANDKTLAAAFDGESALNINESVTSGEYTYTLLSVVTGADITDQPYYTDGVLTDRMYAVVAIERADGTPLPPASDDAYLDLNFSFSASPFVKGLSPLEVNAWVLGGNAAWTVVDGVMYHMVECNNVEMFADRGVYIGVTAGGMVAKFNAFLLDETTGEISVNPDYEGSCALFKLPLDESLADPERAEEFLTEMTSF